MKLLRSVKSLTYHLQNFLCKWFWVASATRLITIFASCFANGKPMEDERLIKTGNSLRRRTVRNSIKILLSAAGIRGGRCSRQNKKQNYVRYVSLRLREWVNVLRTVYFVHSPDQVQFSKRYFQHKLVSNDKLICLNNKQFVHCTVSVPTLVYKLYRICVDYDKIVAMSILIASRYVI